MEFVILKKEKKNRIKNTYKFTVTFMFNDADGYDTIDFLVPEHELKNPAYREELERLIKHFQKCINLDSRGSRGIDDVNEIIKRYSKVDDWKLFCTDPFVWGDEEELDEFEEEYGISEDNLSNIFQYSIPVDGNCGFWYKYDALEAFYYDSNGDEFPVEIKN